MSRLPQPATSRYGSVRAPASSSLAPPSLEGTPRQRTKSAGPASRPVSRSPIPPVTPESSVRTRVQASANRSEKKAGLAPRTPVSSPRTPLRPNQAKAAPSPGAARQDTKTMPTKLSDSAPLSTKSSLSMREQIALKRAEAKKAVQPSPQDEFFEVPPHAKPPEADDDPLGRSSLRDAIDKARSTGSLNIAMRDLPCIPSALFEIHLNVTPESLPSVTEEPPITPGSGKSGAWFEGPDLEIIRASTNAIVEIQPEISMFGSLKNFDLHKNKIERLPASFADLCSLRILNLAENQLTDIPANIWSLPFLTNLNLSHNNLHSLSFNAPFASPSEVQTFRSTSIFEPEISRAKAPCPALVVLDASHNRISAKEIDRNIPASLTRLDLSHNPLGDSHELFNDLSELKRLKELILSRAEVDDASFPPEPYPTTSFPALALFDLEESGASREAASRAFSTIGRELDYTFTSIPSEDGTLRIIVGKKVVKEAWEVEAEKRTKARAMKFGLTEEEAKKPLVQAVEAPPLENAFPPAAPPSSSPKKKKPAPLPPREVVKESWEIEAEQGLLTEGGRRRARAAAALAREEKEGEKEAAVTKTSPNDLTSRDLYDPSTLTLTFPTSAPPTLSAKHGRSISLAINSGSMSLSNFADFALPAPTLPLDIIVAQPYAQNLRVLILNGRRLDKSFSLPSLPPTSALPFLEKLSLEGCSLADTVPTFSPSSSRVSKPIIDVISALFPSLRTLNLSYNNLTSACLSETTLSTLILACPQTNKAGLRHLELRGNKLSGLDGFAAVAEKFKGNRVIDEWKLEELDLRDNEIGKLPAELGLMPLDVFLVDGNTFRVPQRRVWEREGTKGLLSWLRGRIE